MQNIMISQRRISLDMHTRIRLIPALAV